MGYLFLTEVQNIFTAIKNKTLAIVTQNQIFQLQFNYFTEVEIIKLPLKYLILSSNGQCFILTAVKIICTPVKNNLYPSQK